MVSLVQFQYELDIVVGWQEVLRSLRALLLPWLPTAAWVIFWLFCVNWLKLRKVLLQGGWIAVVLLGVVIVLVWGTVAPADPHPMLGLQLSNFVGKTVYVTGLFCVMFGCGSLQLAGCCRFADESHDAASAAG